MLLDIYFDCDNLEERTVSKTNVNLRLFLVKETKTLVDI
jgi:hypothetical protein